MIFLKCKLLSLCGVVCAHSGVSAVCVVRSSGVFSINVRQAALQQTNREMAGISLLSTTYLHLHLAILLKYLTCFHASFFPFCSLCWPPLFLPFSRHLFALFFPSKSALFCRERGTAQSLERGIFRMDLSTKFGKEIPFRNLRENRSDTFFRCVKLHLHSYTLKLLRLRFET